MEDSPGKATSPELPPAKIPFMLVRSSPPFALSGLWQELQDSSNSGTRSSWKFGFSELAKSEEARKGRLIATDLLNDEIMDLIGLGRAMPHLVVEDEFLGVEKGPKDVFQRFDWRFASDQGSKEVCFFLFSGFARITTGIEFVYDNLRSFTVLEKTCHDFALLDSVVGGITV